MIESAGAIARRRRKFFRSRNPPNTFFRIRDELKTIQITPVVKVFASNITKITPQNFRLWRAFSSLSRQNSPQNRLSHQISEGPPTPRGGIG